MTPNSLFPAKVVLGYHSSYGQHVQTIPTLAFDPGDGTFDTWAGGAVDAVTMIDELVTPMLNLYPNSVSYDTIRIFTYASPTAEPLLAYSAVFTGPRDGCVMSPGWSQAVQGSLTYLAVGGSKGRLVFLDSDSDDNWSPQFVTGGSGPLFDIMNILGDGSKGWATRGGGKPETFLQYSKTLNEKLRREYHMF